MAMAMQELEIVVPIRSAKGARDAMVNFQQVSLFEIEETPMTSPTLLLEQEPHFWRRLGMGTLPFCPEDQVSITWAFSALHLHISLNWRLALEFERPRFVFTAP